MCCLKCFATKFRTSSHSAVRSNAALSDHDRMEPNGLAWCELLDMKLTYELPARGLVSSMVPTYVKPNGEKAFSIYAECATHAG